MILSPDERKKLILVIMWTSFILIAYFRLLLGPQLARLGMVNDDLWALDGKVTRLEVAVSKQRMLTEERKRLLETLSGHEGLIVREGENIELLRELSVLAEKYDVRIVSIRDAKKKSVPLAELASAPEAGGGATRERLIHLRIASGYHELGDFINMLEKMTPVLQVVNLDIRSNSADPLRHDVTMLLRSFSAVTQGDG